MTGTASSRGTSRKVLSFLVVLAALSATSDRAAAKTDASCDVLREQGRIVDIALPAVTGTARARISEEARYAFVVGNQDYEDGGGLAKANQDACSVARTLSHLDFEVSVVLDGTSDAMGSAFRRFVEGVKQSKRPVTVVFYYSGFGVGVDGNSYLLPTDMPLSGRTVQKDLRSTALPVGGVLSKLERVMDSGTLWAVLDTCDAAHPPSLGVKGMLPQGQIDWEIITDGIMNSDRARLDQFVLRGSEPGRVSYEGPPEQLHSNLTEHLLAAMAEPGRSIGEVSEVTARATAIASENRQIPTVIQKLRRKRSTILFPRK